MNKKALKSYILNPKSNLPKAYQQGWIEFYKLKFKVTPDVLIPRPETELLVDEVLKSIKYYVSSIKEKDIIVLDVGTGAGNIAISLAKNMLHTRGVTIIATDVSDKALKIAEQNAKLHGVQDKIKFIQSNLLSGLSYTLPPKPYTLAIVTNLPYIPTQRIPYLDSSVKDFEPHVALDGGEDGFELYRKLFQQIKIQPRGLEPKLLVGEIDYTHGELAINEAMKFFPKAQVEVKLDLAHRQRILIIGWI